MGRKRADQKEVKSAREMQTDVIGVIEIQMDLMKGVLRRAEGKPGHRVDSLIAAYRSTQVDPLREKLLKAHEELFFYEDLFWLEVQKSFEDSGSGEYRIVFQFLSVTDENEGIFVDNIKLK